MHLLARGLAEGAEQQVLLHRQLREQAPALGDQGDAEVDDLLGGELGEVVGGAVDVGDDARPRSAAPAP